ncbi:MAG: hypothetical protein F4W98_10315 [Acidimicrobiales bacterium]|nr:hypothetical protein [Acidimicrobiales bacterium]
MTRRGQRDSGLASLEWLLIIAAVGGFAAVMAVAVQRLLDDATETRAAPTVRLLEANVLAAELSSRAVAAARSSGLDPNGALFAKLRGLCERLASDYPDTISAAAWTQVPVTDLAPVATTATTAAESTETTAAPPTPTTLAGQTTTTFAAQPPVMQWACQVTGRSP